MRWLFIILITLSFPALAEVYKWTDANGNVHFGSQPPPGQQEEVHIRESKTGSMVTDRQRRMMEQDDREERMREVARKYEQARKDYSDRPDYICTGAEDRLKSWRERWDRKRRQGYSIREQNFYEQEIADAERERDNLCR